VQTPAPLVGRGTASGDNPAIARNAPTPRLAQRLRARLLGLLMRMASLIVPDENPDGAIYGLVAVGSLLAVESTRRETYLDMVLSVFLAACMYWLVHAYASLLGQRLRGGEQLGLRPLAHALGHNWAVMRGAALPISVLIIEWLAGAGQETGLLVATWSVVVGLIGFELLASLRARATPRELALQTALGATIGLAVLGLRAIVH
jgi:hypothetical protein